MDIRLKLHNRELTIHAPKSSIIALMSVILVFIAIGCLLVKTGADLELTLFIEFNMVCLFIYSLVSACKTRGDVQ